MTVLGRTSLVLVVLACGCATLTPGGSGVAIYRARLDAPPAQRTMPDGCRLLSATPPQPMTELDLEGQKDPFRNERNEAGVQGGNALLVLTQMTVSRHDGDCPAASPITDCPPSFGAWYRAVVETYSCTPEALHALAVAPPVTKASNVDILRP